METMEHANMKAEVAELRRLGQQVHRAQESVQALAQARQDRAYRLMVTEGLTQAMLAELLGLSPSTAQSLVRAARNRTVHDLAFDDLASQGRWARELRLRAGLERKEVARMVGAPLSWVKNLEDGRPLTMPGLVPKLFQALGADVSTFVVAD